MFAVTSGACPPWLFYEHDIYCFDRCIPVPRFPVSGKWQHASIRLLSSCLRNQLISRFPLGHASSPSGVISRIEVLEYTHSGRGLLALQVRGDGTEGCVSLALGQ